MCGGENCSAEECANKIRKNLGLPKNAPVPVLIDCPHCRPYGGRSLVKKDTSL